MTLDGAGATNIKICDATKTATPTPYPTQISTRRVALAIGAGAYQGGGDL